MIKYLGSKLRLLPVLNEVLSISGATTALDLFTGTTRVAQEFKQQGAFVTAVDVARYSEVFAKCHIETDEHNINKAELIEVLRYLSSLPGYKGYFTETFCIRSRFFQPFNGMRIDAIRDTIEKEFRTSPLYPVLLTSLIYAADQVDSTTGIQASYIKQWAPRSFNPLRLQIPELYKGSGRAIRGDAREVVHTLDKVDLAYLDPPYNHVRYDVNYHIWETLVAWDKPAYEGVACRRADLKDPTQKSIFNVAKEMPIALRQLVGDVKSEVLVLSYNNESWLTLEDLVDICSVRGPVGVLAFDSKRYIGAKIGVYGANGEKVGKVSHLRNVEYVLVAGPEDVVRSVTSLYEGCHTPHRQMSLFSLDELQHRDLAPTVNL